MSHLFRDGRHFKTAEAKKNTLGELIDRFITQWLPRHPKRQPKQTALLTWWKNRIGDLLLADFSSAIIAEARDFLLSETPRRKLLRSPSTVNRYLASLSKALSIAVKEWGWLDNNPMHKVSKLTESAGRSRFLSLDEKSALLEACKKSKQPYLYPIVCLAILTSMRQGEIIKLKWEDIDFINKKIIVDTTKNGERHILPLTEAMSDVLKNCQKNENPTGNTFQSSNLKNKSGYVDITKSFHNALKIAGIEDFRFHDLRHTTASYCAMNGATQGELMTLLNHKSPTMTKRYTHYSQDHMRKLLEKTGSEIIAKQKVQDEEI